MVDRVLHCREFIGMGEILLLDSLEVTAKTPGDAKKNN